MVHERTTVVRTVDGDSVGETIVFAVAAARDVRPTELETPLYAAIDADALERLVSNASPRSTREAVRVEFTWAGCDVTVHGTGRVVATEAADRVEGPRLLAD